LTKFRKIGAESTINQKKTGQKIGRELINQGASTYLISGSTLPLSGQFDKISENWSRKCDRTTKNPAKNWSGVN
jgi:transposase-like protein